MIEYTILAWLTWGTLLSIALWPFTKRKNDSTAYILPLLAIGAAIAKGVGSWAANRARNAAEVAARNQENANVANVDKFNQDLVARLKAAGYDPYGPQTTTTNQTSSGQTITNEQIRKVLHGSTKVADRKAMALLEKRLDEGGKVTEGEKLTFARNALDTSEGARRAIENVAASRGLSGAQAGGLATPVEMGRTKAVLDFLANIPNVEREREAALRQEAFNVSNARLGENRTGVTSTNNTLLQSITRPPSIGELQLLAPGAKVSPRTGYSQFADVAGGAGDILGSVAAWRMQNPGSSASGVPMSYSGVPQVQQAPWWTPNTGNNFAPNPNAMPCKINVFTGKCE